MIWTILPWLLITLSSVTRCLFLWERDSQVAAEAAPTVVFESNRRRTADDFRCS
ncbi:MAG: hypothetical protein U1F20_07035 [Lysobacterales bacterium]